MNDFSNVKDLWKRADKEIRKNESLDSKAVRSAIAKQSIGISSKVLKSILTGIWALALSATLFSFNIYGYAGNELISNFSICSLILSAIFLLYLSYQYNRFDKIDKSGLSLQNLILAKIAYFRKTLFLVHHVIGMGLVLLIFSTNLIADNVKGEFHVNNIWLFLCFLFIAYSFVVIVLHLIHKLYLKQYRTALVDLSESKLTELDAELRKQKLVKLFSITFILLSVAAGLVILILKLKGQ